MSRTRAALFARCLVLAILAPSAHADWLEVSSNHFVIYADQNEKDLTRFADRLERFHAAMTLRFGVQEVKPSPSNRVTVYVVPNLKAVRKLHGGGNRFVGGFYRPRAGATVAVVPRLEQSSASTRYTSESALLHEYAHHFMYGMTARSFPRWFVEGFAEFFASARFQSDGSVGLGAAANYRVAELVYARDVPIRTMLEFDGGTSSKTVYDAFYGQSWILFHYLNFAQERAGQLVRYQEDLASGKPALAAAESAFGDLDQLEDDLNRYQRRKTISMLLVKGSVLQVGPISVRKLRPGEADMMPIRIESRIGVTREEALELLPEARRVAALHPDDPAVLAALAEAEFDAGNFDAAIAAADRALGIDPGEIDAHIQKGHALYRQAEDGASPRPSWQEVRKQYIRANKVENDNPIPLAQNYRTYREEGESPPDNAIRGLEWAMVLAPFDLNLRWMVAQQMIADGRLREAANTLGPIAYSPHPGEHTANALQVLKDVEARLESEPVAAGN